MIDELERLRSDLKAIKRQSGYGDFEKAIRGIERDIRRIEFERLTAENNFLKDRIAELENSKPLAEMLPPFEGPIESIEPVLDPVRVLATAEAIGWGPTVYAKMVITGERKPYKLKGSTK